MLGSGQKDKTTSAHHPHPRKLQVRCEQPHHSTLEKGTHTRCEGDAKNLQKPAYTCVNGYYCEKGCHRQSRCQMYWCTENKKYIYMCDRGKYWSVFSRSNCYNDTCVLLHPMETCPLQGRFPRGPVTLGAGKTFIAAFMAPRRQQGQSLPTHELYVLVQSAEQN